MSVTGKTGRQAFGWERHLMWCGADGERELHCYTAAEVAELFSVSDAVSLTHLGLVLVKGRGRMDGLWIDLIHAGEAVAARELSQ